MIELNDKEFSLLREHLLSVCGIEVAADKRYLFSTRLDAILRRLGCTSFSDFYARLKAESATTQQELVEAMTTHETSFFRDEHPFSALEKRILPQLAANRSKGVTQLAPRLRIFCVGCSTGEEAYSVAMSARSWLDTQDVYRPQDISVLGVDISSKAIAAARQAVYDPGVLAQVAARYHKYLDIQQGTVGAEIRAMVSFAQLNLAEDIHHLGTFDLILCRNVMIYFSVALKRRLLEAFFGMLLGGGVLLLGASEGLYMLSNQFEVQTYQNTSYYCA
ncbi:MAG: protein-glutamate O-methyltransferase CheR, partial [Deltaproteobacteria bacterium]|nr:protein-glutamate O-methyltransferase CheR [Deltaproteobacteria bacterium]